MSLVNVKESRWNRYRVWKPLSLMVLAGLTSPEWEISIVDENLGAPDYPAMPRPDLVGITAFTSQANRAYEVAAYFRNLGVPVVMGGIHATMCLDEVMARVDCVVTGEAEGVWGRLLADAERACGQPIRDFLLYRHLSGDLGHNPDPRFADVIAAIRDYRAERDRVVVADFDHQRFDGSLGLYRRARRMALEVVDCG